jgi:hypothetical protein
MRLDGSHNWSGYCDPTKISVHSGNRFRLFGRPNRRNVFIVNELSWLLFFQETRVKFKHTLKESRSFDSWSAASVRLKEGSLPSYGNWMIFKTTKLWRKVLINQNIGYHSLNRKVSWNTTKVQTTRHTVSHNQGSYFYKSYLSEFSYNMTSLILLYIWYIK